MRKPAWINKRIDLKATRGIKALVSELNLHTVCQESLCPNISECFSSGVATFMILGNICTRQCQFCRVTKSQPDKPDYDEPQRVAEAVRRLELSYVVITSPTRDDLDDRGGDFFCRTVKAVKQINPSCRVEILIPDFGGKIDVLEKIAHCGAGVIGHNLETVPSLYIKVRKGADYQRSLEVLKVIKLSNKNMSTKSGLMLGLGEEKDEVLAVFDDLRRVNCDFLTLGQYLAPSREHYPVKQYILPEVFQFFYCQAQKRGFRGVKSDPYVRSSYLAHTLA